MTDIAATLRAIRDDRRARVITGPARSITVERITSAWGGEQFFALIDGVKWSRTTLRAAQTDLRRYVTEGVLP